MAKIIISPSSEIYHIKAVLPCWEEATEGISEKSPYRVIAIRPYMSLAELGIAVLEAFNFDYDHMFGFYDNVKRYYSSKICYEHPEFIASAEGFEDFGNRNVNKKVFNMNDHSALDIFTRKGKKWLMLFDYGDEWNFWLSLEKKIAVDTAKEYPAIVESKYDAPEQYSAYEDDDF
jgi:hypothetical protein